MEDIVDADDELRIANIVGVASGRTLSLATAALATKRR